jgi:D-alanyl-D-alanine carboxypeptidase (penicillin-binding protein 5/6)
LVKVLSVVVVVLVVVFVVVRLSAAVPKATVASGLSPTITVRGTAASLPWSPVGESAVSVPSVGVDVPSGPEHPVPIASLTKMMTAYIILRDHPLRVGKNGPKITINQAELNDYDTDTVNDEANAQVNLGEVLTERQLLGGMLVHSANNYADTLAMWDAGSISAFVAKMNKEAALLGMDQTHYADPSGYNQASQSTPADLLKVAAPDMANPVFAGFVKMPSITLPVAGTISTYTPLLGVQGVIGVKSGFTTEAGGCDVLAVVRPVHGLPILVLSAVTGQTGPNVLDEAGLVALNVANAMAQAIGVTQAVRTGENVAHVTAAGNTVTATATGTGNMLTWPGVKVRRELVITRTLKPGARRGTHIGYMVVSTGTQQVEIPVVLSHDLPGESLTTRIF